jgi:CheY-like chemotaxis protein
MDKKKILIVDDEVDFCLLVKFELEATGNYAVKVENKGSFALNTAREFRPDLIFLDVLMPDMEGSDIAPKIRNDEGLKNVPVIFLTSLVSQKETENGACIKGDFPFLSKSSQAKDLISCIEKYLGKQGAPEIH